MKGALVYMSFLLLVLAGLQLVLRSSASDAAHSVSFAIGHDAEDNASDDDESIADDIFLGHASDLPSHGAGLIAPFTILDESLRPAPPSTVPAPPPDVFTAC